MGISIHAPIVGYDDVLIYIYICMMAISIHAPIVGCDQVEAETKLETVIFQSTHPSWGATQVGNQGDQPDQFQSTHPSWGATDASLKSLIPAIFQSTHPSWGATKRHK